MQDPCEGLHLLLNVSLAEDSDVVVVVYLLATILNMINSSNNVVFSASEIQVMFTYSVNMLSISQYFTVVLL